MITMGVILVVGYQVMGSLINGLEEIRAWFDLLAPNNEGRRR